MARLPLLPPDIIRVLSFHGPVEIHVGGSKYLARGTAHVAPFDDVVFLFLSIGSPLEKALLITNQLELQARHKEGEYALRITGRGHPGRGLSRHPDRHALTPWAPDGVEHHRLLAAPLIPEHIEFVRTEVEDSRMRYHGPTEAGKSAPSTLGALIQACYGGLAIPFVIAACVVPWVWLAIEGAEYEGRPFALMFAVGAGLGQLGGVRLITLDKAFRSWRRGRARSKDAPILMDALISAGQARFSGWLMLIGSLVLLLILWTWWDDDITRIAALTNCGWLLGPAWLVHASQGKAEASH